METAATYNHDYYSARDFEYWTTDSVAATPSMPLTDVGTPIEFLIQSNERGYLDPREIFLHTELSLLDKNGTAVGGSGSFKVAPINFFSNTQWSQVDVFFNNTLVNSCRLYPYMSYIPTLLYSTETAQKGPMKSGLWVKDVAGIMDVTDENANYAFKQRSLRLLTKSKMELDAPLFCDVLKIPSLIPPKVDVKIKLFRSDPEFCLMTGEDGPYQLKLTKAELRFKRLFPKPSLLSTFSRSLNSGGKIPYVRMEVNTFKVLSESTSFNQEVVNGAIPRRVYVVFVEQSAFDGSYTKNPFRFRHFNLQSIQVDINGHRNPTHPISGDFTNLRYCQLYNFFLSNLGVRWELDNPNVSLEEYRKGFTIFVFNTVASSQQVVPRVKSEEGYVRVTGTFANPPGVPVYAICLMEYENTIVFDKHWNPTVE